MVEMCTGASPDGMDVCNQVFLRKTTPDSVKALAENVPMGATTIVKEKPAEAEKKMTGRCRYQTIQDVHLYIPRADDADIL